MYNWYVNCTYIIAAILYINIGCFRYKIAKYPA